MKMFKRFLLGAASIIPSIYIVLIMFFALSMSNSPNANEIIPVEYRIYVVLALIFTLLSVLTVLGLMAYYMLNIDKNKNISENKKLIWVCCLFFLNVFVIPLYWLLYIRNSED